MSPTHPLLKKTVQNPMLKTFGSMTICRASWSALSVPKSSGSRPATAPPGMKVGRTCRPSEQLGGCEEAEGAEHWRYEDTAVGSREAGPPFEEIRLARRRLYVMAAMIVAGSFACIGASFGFKGAVFHQDDRSQR